MAEQTIETPVIWNGFALIISHHFIKRSLKHDYSKAFSKTFRFNYLIVIHRSPGDSPHKMPVMGSFDAMLVTSMEMLLNKQPSCQWHEPVDMKLTWC